MIRPAIALVLALAPLTAHAEIVPGSALLIVDGDTVRLGAERIRLIGPDAPETHNAHCPAERAAGDRATTRLRELIAGQPVEIIRHGRDRFRRTLAVLRIGGRDVGTILEDEGLAIHWTPGWRAKRQRTVVWCGPGEW